MCTIIIAFQCFSILFCYLILLNSEKSDLLKKWSNLPVFVVGKSTSKAGKQLCFVGRFITISYIDHHKFAVNKLGLNTIGATCGNSELLSEEILKCK